MPETEADTCRICVLPKLYESEWTDEQINEQHTFTDGRVIPTAKRVRRGPQKRADHRLLCRLSATAFAYHPSTQCSR
jgi:type I restriction enzyme R subunit